jgi:hypothetical protein
MLQVPEKVYLWINRMGAFCPIAMVTKAKMEALPTLQVSTVLHAKYEENTQRVGYQGTAAGFHTLVTQLLSALVKIHRYK